MVRRWLHGDAESQSILQSLTDEAEMSAERFIGYVRIVVAALFAVSFGVAVEIAEYLNLTNAIEPRQQGRGVGFLILTLAIPGVVAVFLARPKRWRRWMSFAFAAADVLIVTAMTWRVAVLLQLDATLLATVPGISIIPVIFAIGSLRQQPDVQVFTTVAMMAGLGIVVYVTFDGIVPPPATAPQGVFRLHEYPSNGFRLSMLITTGLIIALGTYRARALLFRSLRETQHRKALTRFLPTEIAPLVTGDRFETLRKGQRRVATIMFVDIRGSTAIAEGLDPERLSVFISSFRRRVMRATNAHGGIVDKFIGDGALILFGVLDEKTCGAREAIDCAEQLTALIARWNAKRRFNPPISIGIGVHTGEVYVGVVGDEGRLEFTVLGDSVNVSSRLEQLTKTLGTPLLASAATVEAAGNSADWQVMHDEPLRGRTASLAVCAPRAGLRQSETLPVAGSATG